MGYYTNYIVNASSKNKEQLIGVIKTFNEEVGVLFFNESISKLDDEYLSAGECEVKQRSFDAIKKIAIKYPEVLIEIEGIGEDKEDWWAMKLKGKNYKKAYAEIRSPWVVMKEL